MKLLSILILALGLSLISCGDDTPDNLPTCIDEKLQTFMGEDCVTDLTLWRFRGQDVYCFNYAACPTVIAYADILDADCNLICTLGGIDANNNCDGTIWDQNATFTSTLYEN